MLFTLAPRGPKGGYQNRTVELQNSTVELQCLNFDVPVVINRETMRERGGWVGERESERERSCIDNQEVIQLFSPHGLVALIARW